MEIFRSSEQSYKFFQFFSKSGVVNSISEKKKSENFFSRRVRILSFIL